MQKYIRDNGRFSRLLGVSRKRKLIEMEEEEKVSSSQNELKSELDDKIRKIEDLKAQVNEFEKERALLFQDSAKLEKLYQMGIIDDHGNPLLFKNDDSEYMKGLKLLLWLIQSFPELLRVPTHFYQSKRKI